MKIRKECGASLRDEVARPHSENTSVFSIALLDSLLGLSRRNARPWAWLPRPALFSCYYSSKMGTRRRTQLLRIATPFQRIIVVRDPALLHTHGTGYLIVEAPHGEYRFVVGPCFIREVSVIKGNGKNNE